MGTPCECQCEFCECPAEVGHSLLTWSGNYDFSSAASRTIADMPGFDECLNRQPDDTAMLWRIVWDGPDLLYWGELNAGAQYDKEAESDGLVYAFGPVRGGVMRSNLHGSAGWTTHDTDSQLFGFPAALWASQINWSGSVDPSTLDPWLWVGQWTPYALRTVGQQSPSGGPYNVLTQGSFRVEIGGFRTGCPSQRIVWPQVANYPTYTLRTRIRPVLGLANATQPPPTESAGDRYLIDNSGATHADWDGAAINTVAEYNSSTDTWEQLPKVVGTTAYDTSTGLDWVLTILGWRSQAAAGVTSPCTDYEVDRSDDQPSYSCEVATWQERSAAYYVGEQGDTNVAPDNASLHPSTIIWNTNLRDPPGGNVYGAHPFRDSDDWSRSASFNGWYFNQGTEPNAAIQHGHLAGVDVIILDSLIFRVTAGAVAHSLDDSRILAAVSAMTDWLAIGSKTLIITSPSPADTGAGLVGLGLTTWANQFLSGIGSGLRYGPSGVANNFVASNGASPGAATIYFGLSNEGSPPGDFGAVRFRYATESALAALFGVDAVSGDHAGPAYSVYPYAYPVTGGTALISGDYYHAAPFVAQLNGTPFTVAAYDAVTSSVVAVAGIGTVTDSAGDGLGVNHNTPLINHDHAFWRQLRALQLSGDLP